MEFNFRAVARANFYPCRHQAGHHIPHRAKRWVHTPLPTRPILERTVARRATRLLSGRVDLQFSLMHGRGRPLSRLCFAAGDLSLRPGRNLSPCSR